MKKLFIIIIAMCFLLGMVSPVSAGDKKEVKYEVKITVTYNAVSIKDADRIVANAMRDHQEACDVKVVTKKVGSNGNLTSWGYIMIDSDKIGVE